MAKDGNLRFLSETNMLYSGGSVSYVSVDVDRCLDSHAVRKYASLSDSVLLEE